MNEGVNMADSAQVAQKDDGKICEIVVMSPAGRCRSTTLFLPE